MSGYQRRNKEAAQEVRRPNMHVSIPKRGTIIEMYDRDWLKDNTPEGALALGLALEPGKVWIKVRLNVSGAVHIVPFRSATDAILGSNSLLLKGREVIIYYNGQTIENGNPGAELTARGKLPMSGDEASTVADIGSI